MNISALNLSNLGAPKTLEQCVFSGRLSEPCIYQTFCPQFAHYFQYWAWILLIAYVICDLGLNYFLAFWGSKIKEPHILRWFGDLGLEGPQNKLKLYVKDRLMFAIGCFLLYLLWLSTGFLK
jgi:hypothetical protein